MPLSFVPAATYQLTNDLEVNAQAEVENLHANTIVVEEHAVILVVEVSSLQMWSCATLRHLALTTYEMMNDLCGTYLMLQWEGENVQPNAVVEHDTTVIIVAEQM